MANLQLVAKLVLQAEESKKSIQQIQEQIAKAREEQQKFVAEFGATSEQAVEAAGKVKLLEDSLQFAIDPIGSINDELEFTKKKLEEVTKEFGETSPEAQQLNQTVKVLEDSLDALSDPIKFLNDNIIKAEKNLADAVAQYGELSPEVEDAKAELLALEAAQQKVIKASNEQESETKELATAQADLIKAAKKAEENQKELGKATDKTTDKVGKLNKSLDENSKSSKESGKSTGGLLTILKGAGIVGAAVAAFDLFKEALSKNQKVADTVAAVLKTIQNVLGAVVEVIANVVTKVAESTNGFDALTKVLKGAITIAFTPLKLLIGGISLFIKEAQLAWENSFFGDGDPQTIKELTESINETKESIKETATNAANAGKDIVNNFGEAVSQVGQVVSGVVEGVSKISVGAIFENAKATVQLQNSAKLAAAQLQGVVEAYGTQAEKLRQIRDDDRLSIQERIEANNELGEVLQKQQQAQLALVSQRVAAAAAELSANKGSIELQEALINAQNERAAVLNQIAGFQSEQLANEKALAAEAIGLAKARNQAENENYLQQKKNAAELLTDELAKNKALQAIRNEERALEIQRLTENVDKFKEGTQARLDAEVELQNKVNELNQQDAVAAKERADLILQRDREVSNARIANLIAETNNRKAALENENKTVLEKSKERLKILRDESDILIKQLELQRQQEIEDAEKAGKSTLEIKEKYKNAIEAVNQQIIKSEKDILLAILEENQKRVQDTFKNIQDIVSFYSNIVDIQLAKVQKKQDADNKIQKKLLDDRKITQEQYEKNIAKINEEAEKKKIKLQKRQILAEKGTAIASIIINTLQANAVANYKPGFPASIPIIKQNTIQAIIGVASTIAQTAKALQALGQGGDSGGGGSAPSTEGGGGAPIPPQPETVALPQDQINQLAQANAAVRSYVVESDVTTNQERIVRINRAARIN